MNSLVLICEYFHHHQTNPGWTIRSESNSRLSTIVRCLSNPFHRFHSIHTPSVDSAKKHIVDLVYVFHFFNVFCHLAFDEPTNVRYLIDNFYYIYTRKRNALSCQTLHTRLNTVHKPFEYELKIYFPFFSVLFEHWKFKPQYINSKIVFKF